MDLSSPGPTLGVIGGGQLGRMLAEAATPLGVELVVLDPTPGCPASSIARDQIVADFADSAGTTQLGDRADALTLEIELGDPDALKQTSATTGVSIQPQPETLRTIQDKLVQKQTLTDAGIPVPEFRQIDSKADLDAALAALGPVMLKDRTGGYDGRGNRPVTDTSEVSAAISAIGNNAMAEQLIDFTRELSVIGVKGPETTKLFPVTETIHRDEILRETVTPARTSEQIREQARSVAMDVLAEMDGRGVYGIELFETDDGRVLVNEIAPRPHNSGHWTIEGATYSQFEQHVRAVLGWPLASVDHRGPTVMVNLLGDVETDQRATLHGTTEILNADGAHLHWYGKREARPLRKLGHVTVTADGTGITDPDELLAYARDLRDRTTFNPDPNVS